MTDEIILWRLRLGTLFSSLGRSAGERLLVGLVLSATAFGLVVLFLAIGQYADRYSPDFRWISVGLALTFCAGFLAHLRPLKIHQTVAFLPISPKTITWNTVSAGLRFPLLVGALMLVPYFVGSNPNWFYTSADLLVLVVGTLAVLTAGYLASVALALGVRTVTRHTFIRLLAIVAIVVLAFEFLASPNPTTSAIEATLREANRTATFLVLLGSLGVGGVAVAAIELGKPLPTEQQPHRFWSLLHRNRNLRASFSETEAAFIRTLLSLVRDPALHFRLVILLVLTIIFQAILAAAVSQYPSLQIAIGGASIGVASFLLAFPHGQQSVELENRLFFAPTVSTKTAVGSYLATIVLFGLVISLLAQQIPLGLTTIATLTFSIGTLGYWFGRREAQAETFNALTWLTVLIALSTIFAVVVGTLAETTTLAEQGLILLCWAAAYVALPFFLGRQPRTESVSKVQ